MAHPWQPQSLAAGDVQFLFGAMRCPQMRQFRQ